MASQDTLPVDTGRKLNDLCTFNLRLVSTGWVAKKICISCTFTMTFDSTGYKDKNSKYFKPLRTLNFYK